MATKFSKIMISGFLALLVTVIWFDRGVVARDWDNGRAQQTGGEFDQRNRKFSETIRLRRGGVIIFSGSASGSHRGRRTLASVGITLSIDGSSCAQDRSILIAEVVSLSANATCVKWLAPGRHTISALRGVEGIERGRRLNGSFYVIDAEQPRGNVFGGGRGRSTKALLAGDEFNWRRASFSDRFRLPKGGLLIFSASANGSHRGRKAIASVTVNLSVNGSTCAQDRSVVTAEVVSLSANATCVKWLPAGKHNIRALRAIDNVYDGIKLTGSYYVLGSSRSYDYD